MTPLAVLDLVPISQGSDAPAALRNSIDLARQAERAGYARYWFAEHHLNPGVAGSSPAVVLALTAGATSRIRLGSGAVQLGHRTALSTVEEFGLLDALHPGRFDLGLGRSGAKAPGTPGPGTAGAPESGAPGTPGSGAPGAPGSDRSGPPGSGTAETSGSGTAPTAVSDGAPRHTANGLLLPRRYSYEHLLSSPRFAAQRRLLTQPGARPTEYGEQIDDILALLAGSYRSPEGVEAHAVPGEGADLQVWILGSSGGLSATVAGRNGLRFAANYHVSPATVVEAVAGYRAAFSPSAALERPYVSVSADVVVAPTEAEARTLAAGYGPWVHSIRTGAGAIRFPTPEWAGTVTWTEDDRKLVEDRVTTQFVGTPGQVADQLERLREATESDELIITTITHRHADRVRSYQLLADEWRRRGL